MSLHSELKYLWGYSGAGWTLHAQRPKSGKTSFCGREITSMLRYIDWTHHRTCRRCEAGIETLRPRSGDQS